MYVTKEFARARKPNIKGGEISEVFLGEIWRIGFWNGYMWETETCSGDLVYRDLTTVSYYLLPPLFSILEYSHIIR